MVKIILENVGNQDVGTGQVVAQQKLKDGSVHAVEFFNTAELAPGERTKLSQLLRGTLTEIDFKVYRSSDGLAIPLSGLAKKGLFRWSLAAA